MGWGTNASFARPRTVYLKVKEFFMISPKIMELAAWAQERLLPTCFERAWMTRTKINPVALAVQMVEAENKKKLRKEKMQGAFVRIFLYGGASVALVYAASLLPDSVGIRFEILMAVALFFTVAMVFSLSGYAVASKMQVRSFDDDSEREILAFWTDLKDFRDWGHINAALSRFSDEEFESIAEVIMVKAARLQLEMQKKIPEKAEKETELMLELGDATSEFHRRYGTLQRLGLVSGDFKKFYDKARRQMEQEQYH